MDRRLDSYTGLAEARSSNHHAGSPCKRVVSRALRPSSFQTNCRGRHAANNTKPKHLQAGGRDPTSPRPKKHVCAAPPPGLHTFAWAIDFHNCEAIRATCALPCSNALAALLPVFAWLCQFGLRNVCCSAIVGETDMFVPVRSASRPPFVAWPAGQHQINTPFSLTVLW